MASQDQRHEPPDEDDIIVAGDDAEILADGGRPTLTGTTGASEQSDITADEKPAYQLTLGPMSEDRAEAIRSRIIQMAGIRPERVEMEEIMIGVDSR